MPVERWKGPWHEPSHQPKVGDDLEDGAVSTADEESIEAGGNGVGGLLAGGVGGEGFLKVNVGAVAAEEFGDLFDLGAALLVVDEKGIEEHHDAAHQARLVGFWGLGRPVRRGELGARPENSICEPL